MAELALSLVLLVGAGLLVRSFVALAELDSQFDRTGVLTARLSLDRGRYSDRASVIAFYDQLLARLGSVPGVESVAAGSSVVLPQLPNSGGISVEGQPQEPNAERVEVTTDAVTPGYFGTIGTPILLGRDFGPEDDAGSTPVTIVNEAMVRRFWPAEDPLGKRFKFGNPDGSGPWLTVVGVVADWRRTTPEREARPSSYSPHRQSATRQMMVFARTAGDPLALAGTLREAARELDSDQPVSEIITLEGLLSERLAQRRLVTLMAGLFAAIALLLALVGVYGVLSYAVAQSTREIGLRMALGGDIGRVLAMVYRRLGGLLVVGLAIGTVGAVATTRALGSLLYGVSVLDPTTFVLAPALLGAVALAACYVPARRATRVDPAVALRADA